MCVSTVIITGFSCSLVELVTTNTTSPATIQPVIGLHPKPNASPGRFDSACLLEEIQMRWANNHWEDCKQWKSGKKFSILVPVHECNLLLLVSLMEMVQKCKLWKKFIGKVKSKLSYTICLYNHDASKEKACQDKLVTPKKQSIWKEGVLSAFRIHRPAPWSGMMAGK